jgi:phospholipid transport system substrate-binding protein
MRLALGTRSLLTAAVAVVCVVTAATPVSAGAATDRLREFFGSVNAVLNDPAIHSEPLEKVARIKRLVTEIADVRGAATAVLDREWEARTPAERDEFTRMFAELLERGLVARLAGTVNPVKGMVMSWRGETRVGDEFRVMTVVESRDGRKINVEYRMIERRGRWLVRDVNLDGISTIDNYRSQFKRLLRQGSYAGLVAQLRSKLGEETLMFSQAARSTSAPPASKPVEPVAATRSAAPRVTAQRPAPVSKHVTPPAIPTARRDSPAPTAIATHDASATSVAKQHTRSSTPVAKEVAPPARVASAPAAGAEPVATPGGIGPATTAVAKAVAPSAANAPATVKPVEPAAAVVAPPADVVSPVELEAAAHVLPSALLAVLGFWGVTCVVYLRRRASAHALALQRLRDPDKRLVLVHPVPRVAKVGEGRRKGRIVPAPRDPARHVDDAHGA